MEQLTEYNAPMVLDLLGGRLAYERTGVKLYDAVIRKIELNPDRRYHRVLDYLRHIRDEEKEHEEWLESQIRALGGTAHEITAMAQLESEETSGVMSVVVDGHQHVPHLLHALLAAELADNAGWDLLVKLADEAGDKQAKLQFKKRLMEEAKHLAFVREAVVRAAELEVLGQDVDLPTSPASMLARKPLAIGLVAAGILAAGGIVAAMLTRRRTASRLRALVC
jgi:bacterioferritin (cytochrome b1)